MAFVAFAALNDGVGQIRLDVTIQRLDTLDEIHRRSVSIRFDDQLHEYRCVFQIRRLSFPVSGVYQVSLFADYEVIALRRFRVHMKDEP
jgi:hypothetical protein